MFTDGVGGRLHLTDLNACSIRAELTVRKESVLGRYLSGPGMRKSGRNVEKAGES